MDEKNAFREVIAALGSIAHQLRAYSAPDLAGAAGRLEQIAQRLDQIRIEASPGSEASIPDPDLIPDTLRMLESFRQIENPAIRQTVISMIRALRPDDGG